MKRFLAGVFVTSVILLSGCGGTGNSSNKNSKSVTYSAEQKSAANAEILNILPTMRKTHDDVDKMDIYSSLASESYPPQDGLYWKLIVNKGYVSEYFTIVNFTSGIEWVFWDDVVFSTNEGNWTYHIGSFAGQSGNGKRTQIVMGGKYEFLNVSIDKIAPGLEKLIKGTNPIIRLRGKEFVYDIKLTDNDMNIINTAMYTYEQLKITGNKIYFDNNEKN